MNVLSCKYASSTSIIVQSADIGRQFNAVKTGTKITISVNLPRVFGMKRYLEVLFYTYKASGELTLNIPRSEGNYQSYDVVSRDIQQSNVS